MAEKYLIMITSGLDQKDKAIVGMTFAKNITRKKKAEDVKVVFFGPSEKAFSAGDEDFDRLVKQLIDLGVVQIACNGYAAAHDASADIAKMGLKLEDVSDTIPDLVDKGYKVITF